MAGDDDWIQQYRQGDLSAFQQLYERYRGPLYAYVRRSVSDTDLADELFQDVWVKLLASVDRYERRGRFRAFLFSCAHNVIVDYYRRAEKNPVDLDDVEQPVRPREVNEDLADRIDAALSTLPFEQRQAFYLREVLNCSIREVGEIQDCSTEAARSRLRYAYSRLRDKLADLR